MMQLIEPGMSGKRTFEEVKKHGKILIPWKTVHLACAKLAKKLPANAWLWPVTRGGLPIVSLLLYLREDLRLARELKIISKQPRIIVVDDICCSGKTHMLFEGHPFAVAFRRMTSSTKPDYIGVNIREKGYLKFPWEINE